MGQLICQWLIAFNMAFTLLFLIKRDVEGQPAKQPTGFAGIIGSFVAVAILVAVYYFAGSFSRLLP